MNTEKGSADVADVLAFLAIKSVPEDATLMVQIESVEVADILGVCLGVLPQDPRLAVVVCKTCYPESEPPPPTLTVKELKAFLLQCPRHLYVMWQSPDNPMKLCSTPKLGYSPTGNVMMVLRADP
jgi:hypothetical protein